MPKRQSSDDEERENEWRDWPVDEDDNRFSQEDDDHAGRAWHGMNSDYEVEKSGRFDSDEDEDEDDEMQHKQRPD
jgi:hypothetical protein